MTLTVCCATAPSASKQANKESISQARLIIKWSINMFGVSLNRFSYRCQSTINNCYTAGHKRCKLRIVGHHDQCHGKFLI